MLRVKSADLEINEWGSYYQWEGNPFTGICYKLYPNGQVVSEVEIVDGFENGAVHMWYPSGRLMLVHHAKPGERYSWLKEWFENGNLKFELITEFHVSVMEKVWNEQGQLVSEYERSPLDRKLIEVMQSLEL